MPYVSFKGNFLLHQWIGRVVVSSWPCREDVTPLCHVGVAYLVLSARTASPLGIGTRLSLQCKKWDDSNALPTCLFFFYIWHIYTKKLTIQLIQSIFFLTLIQYENPSDDTSFFFFRMVPSSTMSYSTSSVASSTVVVSAASPSDLLVRGIKHFVLHKLILWNYALILWNYANVQNRFINFAILKQYMRYCGFISWVNIYLSVIDEMSTASSRVTSNALTGSEMSTDSSRVTSNVLTGSTSPGGSNGGMT